MEFGVTYGPSKGKGYTPPPVQTNDQNVSQATLKNQGNYQAKDQVLFDHKGNAYKVIGEAQVVDRKSESIEQGVERLQEDAGNFTDFQTEFLNQHNHYRSLHKVPNLSLKKSLCTKAQAWAEKLAQTGKLERSPNELRGIGVNENIFGVNSNDPNISISAKQVADNWYKEVEKYKFDDSDFEIQRRYQEIGHFSQMVWKNTTSLGVGYAKHEGCVIVVAQYMPAGNIGMMFRANVFARDWFNHDFTIDFTQKIVKEIVKY